MLITEKNNLKTINIDTLEISKALSLLYSIEEDVFLSLSPSKKKQIILFINKLILYLKTKDSKIILHGSGTSGRFAVLVSNYYNSLFNIQKIEGLISGNYDAFIKSKEGSEDNILENVSQIKKIKEKNILYLGISCSGTSNGVLGSLHFLKNTKNKNITTAFLFLNKKSLIKKNVSFYNTSAKEIISKVDLIINPIVGPEPISGSTRLKGGSITQLILDISFLIAGIKLGYIKSKENYSVSKLLNLILNLYKDNYYSLKKNITSLKPIILSANNSLKNNANIYYLPDKSLAPVCLIDASECLPTFGVDYKVVRAFVHGGYSSIFNNNQLKLISSNFKNKHPLDFKKIKINKNDTIIFMFYERPSKELFSLINKISVKNKYVISINSKIKPIKNTISFSLKVNFENVELNGIIRTNLKYILNLISTETFIYSGKTYNNLMIDLKLSNNKLVDRAINRIIFPIVNKFKIVSKEEIIKHLNNNTSKFLNKSFSEKKILSSKVYFKVDQLVPLTILTILEEDFYQALKKINKKKSISYFLKKYKKRC